MLRAVIAFLMLVLLSSGVLADKRVALVIGNSAYRHTPELTNPRNDATDMADALTRLGFIVIEGFDLDKASFDRKLRDFAEALSGANAGVFFYAGHGLQVAGVNYLVPVDAKLSAAAALDWEMVRFDLVQRTMERETQSNVLFLDACRDNPLARNLAHAMGTRSAAIGRGLAATEAGVGTLISFSTQPGNFALDGTGRNSPFAGALVKRIASSTSDLSALLIDVRTEVVKKTQGKQVPWEHSALMGGFYFAPRPSAAPPAGGTPVPAHLSEAAEAWGQTKDTTSIAVLELFIARYQDTFYADWARMRVGDLKKREVVVATPPQPARCDGVEIGLGTTERRCVKPGSGKIEWFKDCPHCPEMVVAPAGDFTMGSPANEPQRQRDSDEDQVAVSLPKPIAVGRFAVTRGEFDAFVAVTGHKTDGACFAYADGEWEERTDRSWRSPGFTQTDRHPVVCVNWHDAKAYVAWLSKTTGKSYRLLSEAEREYVTRAGTATPFWWGSGITPTLANYDGAAEPYKGGGSRGKWRKATVPVDSFAANPWGLYNVHGNVWDWTEDCWKEKNSDTRGGEETISAGDCNRRVRRGGSWNVEPQTLRSASRKRSTPDVRSSAIGFRVARALD
jgi:formylglycine-generating enzyme required for sulfatase activity